MRGQGAFAVPPGAVAALAALLREGRVTLRLQPPPGSAHASAQVPAPAAGLQDVLRHGAAAAADACVAFALTPHALAEEPAGVGGHVIRTQMRAC
jgi:hypothetical protein